MDSTLHNYNYGAVGALLNYGQGRRDFEPNLDSLMDQGRLVSFSTYKPWSTAQDKYYSADNELLVGIECMVRHPAMEPSNFVGTDVKDIQAQYGREWASRNNCLVYFENQKVLVLHRAGSTIDWFKYYWLNDGISQIDEMPEELFSWKKR